MDAASQGPAISREEATSESPLNPDWLLPALDVIAFMAIWTGLTGWSKAPAGETAKRRAPKVLQPVNDKANVVAFPTAHYGETQSRLSGLLEGPTGDTCR